MLYPFVSTQSGKQNRFMLLPELLSQFDRLSILAASGWKAGHHQS